MGISQHLSLSIHGSGFRVQGLGFRVNPTLRFRVKVQHLRFRALLSLRLPAWPRAVLLRV